MKTLDFGMDPADAASVHTARMIRHRMDLQWEQIQKAEAQWFESCCRQALGYIGLKPIARDRIKILSFRDGKKQVEIDGTIYGEMRIVTSNFPETTFTVEFTVFR